MGCNVDPLGEVLIRLFPDGFTLLFAPAAALPAPLPRPPFAPLVEVPVVVPAVVDLVVVPPAAGAELPAAEPVPLCASANVLASVSAAAKPMLVNLMVCFLSLVRRESCRARICSASKHQLCVAIQEQPGLDRNQPRRPRLFPGGAATNFIL